MNEEQKQKMREEFLQLRYNEQQATADFIAGAEFGFQAAYVPRPDLEVVARAIAKEAIGAWYEEDDYIPYMEEAKAAIDVIFNKEK